MIEQCIHPCTITRVAATMAKQNAHPWRRPFPRDEDGPGTIRVKECQDIPQRKEAYLRGSIEPWKAQCPRDEECSDMPRMKGAYPRGTARAKQWQEQWRNSEECPRGATATKQPQARHTNPEERIECSHESPSLLNRESVQEKQFTTNPRDHNIRSKPRSESNIDARSTQVDPWSTWLDPGST